MPARIALTAQMRNIDRIRTVMLSINIIESYSIFDGADLRLRLKFCKVILWSHV
jgi:hypothetical protein